ncbi:MAG: GrpB family protein [Oligoflexia bacterium]|nr:GrpB family protein [Oligoflexia bacterium]
MSIHSIFLENGLGLERDNKVRLVEHNPKWKDVFTRESTRILEGLEIESLKLHHCGSTSITNIMAKPILDIVGEVDRIDELDSNKDRFEAIGYVYKGEYGIPGRRYCVLYNEDQTLGFCHLHIFSKGSTELIDHILFRDYLRENERAAEKYETVKRSLNVPRNEYSDAKTDVITELLKEAREFYNGSL